MIEECPAGGAVRALFNAYAACVTAGDVVAYGSLWDEEAVSMPPRSRPLIGRAAIEEALRSSLLQGRWECALNTEEVRIRSDLCFARGRVVASVRPLRGGRRAFLEGSFLSILRRRGQEGWKIFRFCSNPEIVAQVLKTSSAGVGPAGDRPAS